MSPRKRARQKRRVTRNPNFIEKVLTTLGAEPGLSATQIALHIRNSDSNIDATKSTVNSVLYGRLASRVFRTADNTWYLTGQNPKFFNQNTESIVTEEIKSPTGTPTSDRKRKKSLKVTTQKRRMWTQDETILAYWILPIVRSLSDLTERNFSSISMKLANLLAAETEGVDGLNNTSHLDRAVVSKYKTDKQGLEKKALKLINSEQINHSRIEDIRPIAVKLLADMKVPLHVDVIVTVLLARNPTGASASHAVANALRTSSNVLEGPDSVFQIKQSIRRDAE